MVFDGAVPAVKVLQEKGKAAKDPNVCAVDKPILDERLVVDEASKGIKNVLVYFPRPSAVNEDAKKALTGKKVVFDQTKCVFEPHVLGMMVGETVTLKSSDPVNHNVNVKLKQSRFNNTIGGGQSQDYPLSGKENTPGPVVCDIHPWMSAVWMVLDNPYITVTDEKGNFEIKNVPAGDAEGGRLAREGQGRRFRDGPVGRTSDDQGRRHDRAAIQDRCRQAAIRLRTLRCGNRHKKTGWIWLAF